MPRPRPGDPVESAVASRLARTWGRRATVRRAERDLDPAAEAFDPELQDYPDSLLPFGAHPAYLAYDEEQRRRIRAWAWISFNKNVMDVERCVVEPGFDVLAQDRLAAGVSGDLGIAVYQSMVDEQYHTLMHHGGSEFTRTHRGWPLPNWILPQAQSARRRSVALSRCTDERAGSITSLAYTTVAEISITTYLDLFADDPVVQPFHRATVRLHNRDEYCHASITADAAAIVYDTLTADERTHFEHALVDAMDAFTSNDYTTWRAVLHTESLNDAMIRDVETDTATGRLVQDYSGIRSLADDLGITGRLDWEW
ncbi:diiron oxygenase [Rhodococcus rhodnii]|uniref:Diiron oxygenase n=2 Tax=Rhodococcus rhodnii TaxID=38312 RepID=A0A6P2CJQ5_9NOCA|nr:diiron oxygenase [Rhodococcus rhodnii]TXG92552.1 diiron oxygenase [Rhodococcus rhodnii]